MSVPMTVMYTPWAIGRVNHHQSWPGPEVQQNQGEHGTKSPVIVYTDVFTDTPYKVHILP